MVGKGGAVARRIMAGTVLVLCAFCTALPPALAQDVPASETVSGNDYGGVGLLQMRTARFAPDGQFNVGTSMTNPYRRYYLTWQILPWAEISFRYTDTTNVVVETLEVVDQGQGEFFRNFFRGDGRNTHLDRAFDLKFRLWEEGEHRPALAVGLQDTIGTGLFSGEYLVASKRHGDFDFTLGMAWGYLGSRGGLKNPLRLLSSRFKSRAARGRGGQPILGNFFAGERVGLFGGMEYRTPIRGLTFKAEYSAIDPDKEPLNNPMRESLPINIGFNYRPHSWFDLALGWEHGNALMVRLELRSNFNQSGMTKIKEKPPPVKLRASARGAVKNTPGAVSGALDVAALNLRARLAQLGLPLIGLERKGGRAVLRLAAGGGRAYQAHETAIIRALFAATTQNRLHLTVAEQNGETLQMVTTRAMARDWARMEGAWRALDERGVTVLSADYTQATARFLMACAPAGCADKLAREEALLPLIPATHQRVITTSITGASRVFARAAVAQRVVAQRAGPLLASHDMTMTDVTISGGASAIRIAAPFWATPEDYRVAAAEVLRVTSDVVGEVTLVGEREGAEIMRLSVRLPRGPAAYRQLAAAARRPSETAAGQTTAGQVAKAVAEQSDDTTQDALSQDALAAVVFRELDRHGLEALAFQVSALRATVYLSQTRFREPLRNVGWASRVVANHAPGSVEAITVVTLEQGLEVNRVTVMRHDLEKAATFDGSPEEIWAHHAQPPPAGLGPPPGASRNARSYPRFHWGLAPRLRQHIGDPTTGIYAVDLIAVLSARLELRRGLQVSVELGKFIVGNLDSIVRDSNSVLPRVRSDIKRYVQEGRNSIIKFQADYLFNLAPKWYGRVSAGIFEQMFGGVGGEVLYHPPGARYAVGVDVNWVKQRAFNQRFGFRDYQVVTGHVNAYYDLPFQGMRLTIHAGRYLARDRGVTFDLSREFKSGVRVGGFFTLTNVSAAQFGEGSFDKGFYISFPLDLFSTRSSKKVNRFEFRPLTRDGGQRLNISPRLFNIVKAGEVRRDGAQWDQILN